MFWLLGLVSQEYLLVFLLVMCLEHWGGAIETRFLIASAWSTLLAGIYGTAATKNTSSSVGDPILGCESRGVKCISFAIGGACAVGMGCAIESIAIVNHAQMLGMKPANVPYKKITSRRRYPHPRPENRGCT